MNFNFKAVRHPETGDKLVQLDVFPPGTLMVSLQIAPEDADAIADKLRTVAEEARNLPEPSDNGREPHGTE